MTLRSPAQAIYVSIPATVLSFMPNIPELSLQMASPSIPVQLHGFVAGNTIHVEGDAGNIHFSGQFNISQRRDALFGARFDGQVSPETVGCESHLLSPARAFSSHEGNNLIATVKSPPSTPPENPNPDPIGFPYFDRTDADSTPETFQTPAAVANYGGGSDVAATRTRLRSGAISRVAYFPLAELARVCESRVPARGSSGRPDKRKRRGSETDGEDLLEKVLRRHSFPTRPCNSYTFFVMARWGTAQSSSFRETSRRLSDAWRKLPECEKNEFMEMARKDNERYKRQCMHLRSREKKEED